MTEEIKRLTLRMPFEMWRKLTLLSTQAKLEGRNESITDIALVAIERELERREKAGN